MKKASVSMIVTALVFLSGTIYAGGAADDQQDGAAMKTYTLQFALAAADAHEMGVFIHEVKDNIEARSDGNIKVDIYPNSQLGGDRELLEGCQAGNISMVVQATSPQVTFMPELAVFDIPSVMTDMEDTYEALQGEFGDRISRIYEDAGYQLLTLYPIANRQMTSNVEVRSFEDFRGIKIRTMENPYHIAFWKSLGANPTPLNFSELYIALQQGVVDAQENPAVAIIATKLFEQQKYFINTNHIQFLTSVIMNKDLYDGMPEEYRQLIDDVVSTAAVNNMNLMMANGVKNIQFLKDNGVEVIDLSSETMAQIRNAATPVYSMIRSEVGDDLVDSLLDSLGLEL